MTRRLFFAGCGAVAMLASSVFAANTQPKTVIHVISVQWKKDATPAQIDKAIQVVEALPAAYPGILHVWVKPIKKQLPEGYSHVIVMEFASQEALTKYAGSAAQKKFYEAYMPVREESRTSDITN